jgi:photosystem II stability/assembly factor-like uncharacterized protein
MKVRSSLFVSVLAALLLAGGGCVSVNTGGSAAAGSDGGIFKTTNKGDNWLQKAAVPSTTGEKRSIGNVNVISIVQDPQDANALYLGTTDNGVFYTYDGGESWMQPPQIIRGRVPSVAIHPKDKCTIYAAIENKLLKSEDCSRSWSVTYLDARLDKLTAVVAVDFFNPQIVWIANNAGDVLKSTDGGASWQNAHSFNNPVVRLAMHSSDSRRVFVATKTAGIWRTDDGGGTWKNLSDGYKDKGGSMEFFDLSLGVSDANIMVFASKFGLLRSLDSGETWEPIELLTPPGTTLIYSVAVDPKDVNNLYYGTSTTFYRSPNGGVNWIPKKLPSTRTATALLVDRTNPNVLYMGMTRFKQ